MELFRSGLGGKYRFVALIIHWIVFIGATSETAKDAMISFAHWISFRVDFVLIGTLFNEKHRERNGRKYLMEGLISAFGSSLF